MSTDPKPKANNASENERHFTQMQQIKKEKNFIKGTQQQRYSAYNNCNSIAYKNNYYNNMDSVNLIFNNFESRDLYSQHY